MLITVASLWGRVTSPYASAYVTSKFGVRAFSECLRQGFRDIEGSDDIHVRTVLPESIDTPIFRHAGNFPGHDVRPVPPVVPPRRVAGVIAGLIGHPKHEVTVGFSGHALEWMQRLLPARLFTAMLPRAFSIAALGGPVAGASPGNVFAPMPAINRVSGDWRRWELGLLMRVGGAAAAAAGLTAAGAQAWRRSRG